MFKRVIFSLLCLIFVSNPIFAFDNSNRSSVFTSDMQKTWEYYMREVEYKIKNNWKPPQSQYSAKIVIYMQIGKNGELLDLKVKERSYSKKLDNSAREAVIMSAPFEPLPNEYKGKSVPIEFSFDYKVRTKK